MLFCSRTRTKYRFIKDQPTNTTNGCHRSVHVPEINLQVEERSSAAVSATGACYDDIEKERRGKMVSAK